MEKIESTDLLMAILVNLPPKSVFRFMCVSTRWTNLIKDPLFLQSYSINSRKRKEGFSSKRLLAFIEVKRKEGFRKPAKYCDPLSPFYSGMKISPVPDQTNNYKFDKVPERLGYLIGCSNGLILCGRHRTETHYILNPIRGTRFFLPPPPGNPEYPYSIGLVCEENTNELVPYFKVVRVGIPNREATNTMSILTYSSRTRKWASSTLIATEKFSLFLAKLPVVVNGIFHWFSHKATLAVYDSNECDNHIQLIVMPYKFIHDCKQYPPGVTRSSTDGVLWFVFNDETSKCLEFWMLPKHQEGGYKRSTTIPRTEWILKQTISYHSLCQKIPINMIPEQGTVDNDFIKLEWVIPGNPVLALLRIGEVICLYNLETESMEVVPHGGACPQAYLCPYVEPVSLSSYAL